MRKKGESNCTAQFCDGKHLYVSALRRVTWLMTRAEQMSRDEGEAAVRVSLPEGTTATVGVREGMSVEEFLAAACARRSLNPLEHFVRVKKRRDMEDHNYFVPHRSDLIETYVSI